MQFNYLYSFFLSLLFLAGTMNTARAGAADTLPVSSRFLAHRGGVFALAMHPNGKWLASGGLDAEIKIWDLTEQKKYLVLKGHEKEITALAFSVDGKYLVSASYDGQIILRETNKWRIVQTLNRNSWTTALAFDDDGNLVIGFQDGILQKLSVPQFQSLYRVDASYSINSLAIASGRNRVITGGPVSVWDNTSGKLIKRPRLPGGVNGVAASADVMVSVHTRGTAFIMALPGTDSIFSVSNLRRSRVPAPSGFELYDTHFPMLAAALTNAGDLLALACYNQQVLVYNIAQQQLLQVLQTGTYPITRLLFSVNGKKIVGAASDGNILVWELPL